MAVGCAHGCRVRPWLWGGPMAVGWAHGCGDKQQGPRWDLSPVGFQADGGRLGCTTPALEERQQLLLQAAGQQHQPLMAEQAQPHDHRVDVALPLPAMLQMLA